jgi:UDP-glucuronate 4-epimerase
MSFYAATKISNEATAHTFSHLYGIQTTGLRFFTVYGPWGRPDMAYWKFAESIVHGKPIKLYFGGKAKRDFTYIDDVVRTISSIVEKSSDGMPHFSSFRPLSKVYNVGNHTPIVLSEFVRELECALGKKADIELSPPKPGDVQVTFADVSELQRDYGFAPNTDLRHGLTMFTDWYVNDWLARKSQDEGTLWPAAISQKEWTIR